MASLKFVVSVINEENQVVAKVDSTKLYKLKINTSLLDTDEEVSEVVDFTKKLTSMLSLDETEMYPYGPGCEGKVYLDYGPMREPKDLNRAKKFLKRGDILSAASTLYMDNYKLVAAFYEHITKNCKQPIWCVEKGPHVYFLSVNNKVNMATDHSPIEGTLFSLYQVSPTVLKWFRGGHFVTMYDRPKPPHGWATSDNIFFYRKGSNPLPTFEPTSFDDFIETTD